MASTVTKIPTWYNTSSSVLWLLDPSIKDGFNNQTSTTYIYISVHQNWGKAVSAIAAAYAPYSLRLKQWFFVKTSLPKTMLFKVLTEYARFSRFEFGLFSLVLELRISVCWYRIAGLCRYWTHLNYVLYYRIILSFRRIRCQWFCCTILFILIYR